MGATKLDTTSKKTKKEPPKGIYDIHPWCEVCKVCGIHQRSTNGINEKNAT